MNSHTKLFAFCWTISAVSSIIAGFKVHPALGWLVVAVACGVIGSGAYRNHQEAERVARQERARAASPSVPSEPRAKGH